eukprot:COSAG06_NODE_642_length_13482_cov_21.927296_14_plen_133_part_00
MHHANFALSADRCENGCCFMCVQYCLAMENDRHLPRQAWDKGKESCTNKRSAFCRTTSADPTPKLAQLDAVAALRARADAGEAAAAQADFEALWTTLRSDPSLAKYRNRHFPPEAIEAEVRRWAASAATAAV